MRNMLRGVFRMVTVLYRLLFTVYCLPMHVLMLSTDHGLLDPKSAVALRVAGQARFVRELHAVVFAPKAAHAAAPESRKHLTVHSTDSVHQAFFMSDAYRIGKDIIGKEGGKWIVTAQDPFWTGVVGFLLAKSTGAALHIQLHTDPFSREWRTATWLRKFQYPLALYLLKRADAVRVISERLHRSVSGLGVPEERITVLPIPTDVKKFLDAPVTVDLHKAYSEYAKVVLSMGRLTKEKDFALLLRAFARLRKTHEDALLVLVGHGPLEKELRFLARALDIERHVRFLPWAREVASYYKTADVYVQPSLYEGWGLAVVEALSSGTPVVMTDVGCAGELVIDGKTGLVVTVGDEEALADAISWVLTHPKEARRLGNAGREAAEKLATPEEAMKLYKESWRKARTHAVSGS